MKRIALYLIGILVLVVAMLPATGTSVLAADTGVRYPGTASSTSESPYDDESWYNPTYVGANDGNSAEIENTSFNEDEYSYTLRATSFGFSIPTGSTIQGIKVEIERNRNAGSARDAVVQLTKNGTSRVGSNKADTSTSWPSSMTIATYGGPTDLWGTTWTPAEINSSSFGAHLVAQAYSDSTNIYVDFIRITVYYSTAITVTINQASTQVDPTYSSLINFTVVFGASVSDFATGDVSLSGTAGATTATVSGTGTTYDVAVSGMTTSGTVIASILAGVAHDGSGTPNAASTSTDNTVSYTYTTPNPTLTDTCGLDIVLVMDESTSIDATEFTQMKQAFKDFVDAFLPKTPTQFALVDFSTTAVVRQTWTSDANTIKNAIDGTQLTGYTNWQQGLILAQGLFTSDRPDHPDLIVFASDGNPTAYGSSGTIDTGGTTALAYAITAANAIKSDGIRIVTIGIGDELNSNNLVAISGPIISPPADITKDTDVILGSFSTLADILSDLSCELCGGTITVYKVIDNDCNLATTADQIKTGTPVQNWQYTISVTSGGSANPASGTTDATGATVAFDISITDTNAIVNVTETVKLGYNLLNAVCTGATGNGTFDAVNHRITGIVIGKLDIVSITFYNSPVPDCTITLDADSNDGTVCAGSTGHTASVTPVSGASYAWTITGGTITAGQGTASITFSAGSTPGTLTVGVTITTPGGCSCTNNRPITIQGPPDCTITLNLNSDSLTAVCANSTGHTASVASAGTGASYAWTITGGTITAGQGTSSITFSAGSGSSVTVGVTVITSAGCSCTSNQPITIQSPPSCTITLDADSNDGTVCASSTGHTASVASAGAGATYAWTVSGGTITGGQNTPSITFSAGATPGTLTIGVTVTTSAGCTCTNSRPITVAPNPDCTITLDPDSQDGVAEYTTGHTATVAAVSGATYSWTITGNGTITGGQGTNSITFSAGVAGSMRITVGVTTQQGCYCTKYADIVVGDAPDCTITLDADSEDGSVCANSTGHSASVPALAGATYEWTLAGDYINLIITGNSITFDATARITGSITITVEVTTPENAQCTEDVEILVGSIPICTITLDADSQNGVCENSTSHTASVPDAGTGASYTWTVTGNGTITGGQNTRQITFNAGAVTGSGNIHIAVVVTTSVGCTCSNSADITVYDSPSCTITLDADSNDGTVCAGSTGHTASVTPVTGASYNWTITGGSITGGSGTASITFSAGSTPGTLTVGVTVTTSAGCSCTNSQNITIAPNPSCTITLDTDSQNGVCENSTSHTASVPDAGTGASYTWTVTGNGTITGGQNTRQITFNAGAVTGSGNIHIAVVVTTSVGCTCSNSADITVYDSPSCTITLDADSNDGTVCASSTGHTAAVASAGSGATYAWTITGGSITSGQGTNSITFSAGSTPGTLTVGVTVTTSAGCSCTSSQPLTVQSAPVANFSASPTSSCVIPLTVTFTDLSTNNPTSWSWNFGDGGTSTSQNPTHQYTSAGSYTVSLTVTTSGGCSDTETKTGYITTTGCPDCYQCNPDTGACDQITIETGCADGIDNDCDGLIDCNDPDCEDFEACGPVADAGPDKSVSTGNSTTTGGSPTGQGGTPTLTYSWYPTTGVSDPTIPNPTVTPGSTTTYTVTVCDSLGRCDEDSMTVTVSGGGPPGGGGGFGKVECYLIIDMLGEKTTVQIDCCENCTLENAKAYDPERIHLLELRSETVVRCGECFDCSCYPRIIVMSLSEESITAPDGMAIVGPLYDFTGYVDTRRQIKCSKATYFDPSASVLLDYDPALLPEGAYDPVIAFYSHDRERWVILPPDTGRVAEVGVATGMAEYFASPFAVLVNVPEPEPPAPPILGPAHFTASGLNISPLDIKVGEYVTISVDITNDGEQAGTYSAELEINGSAINSENVTLDAGQSETVTFTITETEAGRYEAMVAGLSGVFNVVKPFNWWLLIIIATGTLLAILGWRFRKQLAAIFGRRRRKPKAGMLEPEPYIEPEAGGYPELEPEVTPPSPEPKPGMYPFPAPGPVAESRPSPKPEVGPYQFPYPVSGPGADFGPSTKPAAQIDPQSYAAPGPEADARPSTEPRADTYPYPYPAASAQPEAGTQLASEPKVSAHPAAGTETKADTQLASEPKPSTYAYTYPYLYPAPNLEADTRPSPEAKVSNYPYLYPVPKPAARKRPATKPKADTQPAPEANPYLYPYPYPAAGTEADAQPVPEPEANLQPEAGANTQPAPEANPYLYPYPYPAAGTEADARPALEPEAKSPEK